VEVAPFGGLLFMKLEEWQKQNRLMPLTYIEVLVDKPLVVKLTDDWNFVTFPQKAVNFAVFIDVKDRALVEFEYWKSKKPKREDGKLEKTQGVMNANYALIECLFEISKQEYIDKEKEYREFIYSFFMTNLDCLYDVWQNILDYNTRLEKKNNVPNELRDNTKTRQSDKWRGFFGGRRSEEISTTSFLRILHEDEEETTRCVNRWKAEKDNSASNERKIRRGNYK